jgi:hexosaminidase
MKAWKWMADSLLVAMCGSFGLAAPGAENGPEPSLLPRPVALEMRAGVFQLDARCVLQAGPGAEAEARKLAAAMSKRLGGVLPIQAGDPAGAAIRLRLEKSLEPRLGAEGYQLAVRPGEIRISAAGEAGLFYGGVTLWQLLPNPAGPPTRPPGPEPSASQSLAIPCVEIEDFPRFPWRGLLLDPARHFLPVDGLKRFVNLMALHKLNTLQLHLTDDQGWRLEIPKHPRLTEIGSVRQESPMRGNRDRGDGTVYGPFFYRAAEIRDLVAYARDRHVTILPEIEMPGHFLAALTAYPHLSCRGGPFAVRTRWGVEPDILCPGNEESFALVEDVLAGVMELFPSRFIHIGGDEAPRDRWKACPKCQARMKEQGLKSEAELQTWFNRRVEAFLTRHGRRLVGWDEILEGGLTPGAAVMSWRGTSGGLAAAQAGHEVVMSPTTHCYFDYAQGKGPGEPESIGGFVPLRKVFEFEPVPAGLPEPQRKFILGLQGNVWGEYIHSEREAEYFAYPRAAALAEIGWSPAPREDFTLFNKRLSEHLKRLKMLSVNYRPLDQ